MVELATEGIQVRLLFSSANFLNPGEYVLRLFICRAVQASAAAEGLTQERTFAHLSSLFGLVALLLATIGLYGSMAYSVTRRTHEIGIRLALGAMPRDVVRMVFGKGLQLTLVGVVLGVLAATRLISTMIYGVTPADPMTFAAVAVFLLLMALLACYVPARRATRVDPLVALQHE